VPVVIHDAYLDRTTDGKGAVRDATLGEVMGLSAGYASRFGDRFAAQRVPTLEEVLRLARGEARLLIELKVDGGDSERAEQLVGAVIDHVEAAGALREVALISFDPAALAAARRAAPGVEIGLLAARGAGPVDPVDAAAAAGARMLILAKDLLSEGVAAEAEHARLLLATYSVETAEELAALGAFGLYAVATDWPERLALARGVRLD
jgi:glycerophosphoryl diester phosphodiesterase